MLPILIQRMTRLYLIIFIAIALQGCGAKDDPRLANPKSAAKTLFQAMYDNDVVTAKLCITTGPGQREMVEGMTKMMASMRRATDAAYKRYGDDFIKMTGGALDMAHIDPKQIDDGMESIKGETASIVFQNKKMTLQLLQTETGWKVDLLHSFPATVDMSNPQMIQIMTSMFTGMARAGDQTKADIEAGKYPNGTAAVKALMENMNRAIEEEKVRLVENFKPKFAPR